MSSEDQVPTDIEYKQTPENVWQATAIILRAIYAALHRRDLITADEMRETCDRILTSLQSQIGDGLPGPGVYGSDNPPMDWNTFGTIQEMVDQFCKEREWQEAPAPRKPILSVVEGGPDTSGP
jgi:hypothetical protein